MEKRTLIEVEFVIGGDVFDLEEVTNKNNGHSPADEQNGRYISTQGG